MSRRYGPIPLARVHLRADFIIKIIEARTPMALLAQTSGFRHGQRLCSLLNSTTGVPISTRKHFTLIARLVDYPPSDIFATRSSDDAAVSR